MRIALDAMGSDRHPAVEIEGAFAALEELGDDIELLLVGDRDRIEAEISGHPESGQRLSIIHATQRIDSSEGPASAVRRKPDSSIVRGLSLQREDKVDAFVSAGSTGAVMAASLFLLRPLPGVDRPTVATMLPTAAEPLVMVDAGANVDCKPHHLVQFARLGAVYVQDVFRRESPRIGLLNIGEEPEKGDELAVEAHRLLRASGLNFVGNIEGRDIVTGACDVLVTDGFAGNVLLKFYESVSGFIYGLLEREIGSTEAAAEGLKRVFQVLDYTEYGGAPLLGVNGISIICHGGSPPRAIKNALRVAVQAVEARMIGHMRSELAAAGAGRGGGQRYAEGA